MPTNPDTDASTAPAHAAASAAERELAALTYAISHDLRAPVRALLGFSEALGDYRETLPADAQPFLDHLQSAALRLQQMINALLELSRLSQLPLEPVPVDLPALLTRCLGKVQSRYPAIHPELTLPTAHTVHCDATLLGTAVEALLDNAFKFSADATPPRIEITAQHRGSLSTLCIADHGIGMDLRHATHFGTPFQHFHPQQTGTRSLGIGLATAQRCATRLGGTVWAESIPQKGSKLYLQWTNVLP